MIEVASRELRNRTRALLDMVAAGEKVVITVDGRPAAVLTGVDTRPQWVSSAWLVSRLQGAQADPGLRDDLRELLGDETTDDLD